MRALAIGGCLVLLAGCGRDEAPPPLQDAGVASTLAADQSSAQATTVPTSAAAPDAASDDAARATRASEAGATSCPDDMVYVDTSYCADVERRCIDMEHEPINHLDICHAFAAGEQKCRGAQRRIAFCIDRYEYPNEKGAHPVWMLDWSQAQATCESKGKRLCWQGEWTAACEGPEHTPFPYGWERDHTKCNVDNFYIDPMKYGPKGQFFFYSRDKDVQTKELARLDQSVPSGSMESCKSGFGVYDMPGNVDEWVVSDQPPREASKWAALKGGAWGHVRSQCRPTTYSHEPGFAYYFVGFRCCRDADDAPQEARWTPSPQALPAPKVETHDFAPDPIVATGAPGPSKAKFTRSGHKE